MNITIRVNGSEKELDPAQVPHLDGLVKLLVKTDQGLIVEVNETIIHRDRWPEYPVHDGDIIELISLVGGG